MKGIWRTWIWSFILNFDLNISQHSLETIHIKYVLFLILYFENLGYTTVLTLTLSGCLIMMFNKNVQKNVELGTCFSDLCVINFTKKSNILFREIQFKNRNILFHIGNSIFCASVNFPSKKTLLNMIVTLI